MPDPSQGGAHPGRPDRRQLLKAAAVTGGAVWAAPAILSLDAAAASTCCAATGPATLLATCQPNTNQNQNNCREQANSGLVNVCRHRNQTMLFSRLVNGTQEPYPDELVILTVTPPAGSGGTTQIRNFIRWETDCRATNSTLPDFLITSDNPCGTTTNTAIDVTNMFGTVCGIFRVRAQVMNMFSPYAWSTMFIYPV